MLWTRTLSFSGFKTDGCSFKRFRCVCLILMPQCVMERKCKPVRLEPFVHQVGGSSSVLCFDKHTICKPLIPREHHFYETMPEDMKEFTPEYRGVVEVSFEEDSDGYVSLVAYPINSVGSQKTAGCASCSHNSTEHLAAQSDSDTENMSGNHSQTKHRFRLKRSGSIEILSEAEAVFEQVNPLNEDEDSAIFCHNPWSLRCHRLQLAKMKKAHNTGPLKFILLENLASHFKLPCILDLKMGTQQHGDDSSEEKRQQHMAKCLRSTSSSLGVRICGMQVYQANIGRFVCHDKYYGRQLTVQGFYKTLYQFLHNGNYLRIDLIDCIIERIEKLRQVLLRQNTFRFYSSSLLIMYDGSVYPVDNDMMESAQQSSDASRGASNEEHKLLTTTYNNQTEDSSLNDSHTELDGQTQHNTRQNVAVDVRMIDFAHATHKGFCREDKLHEGPDKGYLFGLDSLIKAFHRLRDTKMLSYDVI